MWRGDALIVVVVGLLVTTTTASVFSEAGSAANNNAVPDDDYYAQQAEDEQRQQILQAILEEEAAREQQEIQIADELMKQEELEQIMAQMEKGYAEMAQELEDQKEQKPRAIPGFEDKNVKVQAPAPLKQSVPVKENKEEKMEMELEPKQEEEVDEETVESQPTASAPTAQKKGQSEFVSFVDPEVSRMQKAVPSMEKRRLNEVRVERIKGDGGLLYLAVGTVMVVGMIGGLVGGTIFYRRRRDEPDDQEYAPYAGTGPRSAKKVIKGEQGDETLAYKAQLHHYQQAKQKIICGEDNAGVAGESEDEGDDIDDENNFSVYECPGLAPTGDIEVHNPNFAGGDAPSKQ